MWIVDETVIVQNMAIMALVVGLGGAGILFLSRQRRPFIHRLIAMGIGMAFGLFTAMVVAERTQIGHGRRLYSVEDLVWDVFAYHGGGEATVITLVAMVLGWLSLEVFCVATKKERR